MLKRSYEIYCKEIQSFVEFYLSGKKRKPVEKAKDQSKEEKKEKNASGMRLSLHGLNFSLLSENSDYETFLNQYGSKLVKGKRILADEGKHESKMPLKNQTMEKSLVKSLLEGDTEFEPNIATFDMDKEKIDVNFTYNRDLFSNYINFDLEGIQVENNQFEEDKIENQVEVDQIKSTIKSIKDEIKKRGANADVLNLTLKKKIFIRDKNLKNFQFDEIIEEEINLSELTKEELNDKKNFKKLSISLFTKHVNNLIFIDEMENFISQLNLVPHGLKDLNNLKDAIHSTFLNEREEKLLDDSQKHNGINKSQNEEISQKSISENFRFDTTNKKKSLDSSALLSNISLQEVFDTSKKLLNMNNNRTSNIFNFDDNPKGIIVEEDSNFNMNTMNLRTNFNNFELDYHNNQEDVVPEEESASCKINMELVSEEVSRYLLVKKKRKSINIVIDLFEISNIIKDQLGNMIKLKNTELESIVFYQMLLIAQNINLNLSQEGSFERIINNL
jgi:hypothetical protein